MAESKKKPKALTSDDHRAFYQAVADDPGAGDATRAAARSILGLEEPSDGDDGDGTGSGGGDSSGE